MSRRRKRDWLRYPARTVGHHITRCPTGLPRFRDAMDAHWVVPAAHTSQPQAWQCDECDGGFHISKRPTK